MPNGENAFIPPAKLRDYLLSEIHPVGRSKALFLKNLGYDDTNEDVLMEDLLAIVRDQNVLNS